MIKTQNFKDGRMFLFLVTLEKLKNGDDLRKLNNVVDLGKLKKICWGSGEGQLLVTSWWRPTFIDILVTTMWWQQRLRSGDSNDKGGDGLTFDDVLVTSWWCPTFGDVLVMDMCMTAKMMAWWPPPPSPKTILLTSYFKHSQNIKETHWKFFGMFQKKIDSDFKQRDDF